MPTFELDNCDICNKERSVEKISYISKPIYDGGVLAGENRTKFCNDNKECAERAITE